MTGDEWDDGTAAALAACALAIDHVQAFLHGEESEDTADEIRHHLMTCEQCFELYSVETLITAMVRRSFEHPVASVSLRQRVACLHVTVG